MEIVGGRPWPASSLMPKRVVDEVAAIAVVAVSKYEGYPLPTTRYYYLLLTAYCSLPTTQDAAAHLRVLSDPSKEYVLHGAA